MLTDMLLGVAELRFDDKGKRKANLFFLTFSDLRFILGEVKFSLPSIPKGGRGKRKAEKYYFLGLELLCQSMFHYLFFSFFIFKFFFFFFSLSSL